jgi:hypothetical protein
MRLMNSRIMLEKSVRDTPTVSFISRCSFVDGWASAARNADHSSIGYAQRG